MVYMHIYFNKSLSNDVISSESLWFCEMFLQGSKVHTATPKQFAECRLTSCSFIVFCLLSMCGQKYADGLFTWPSNESERSLSVWVRLTVSCHDVPLLIAFIRCPFSSAWLWSNSVWQVRGLMIWQAFCCPFGFLSNKIRLERKEWHCQKIQSSHSIIAISYWITETSAH